MLVLSPIPLAAVGCGGVKHLLDASLLKEVICFHLHTNPMRGKVLALFCRQENKTQIPTETILKEVTLGGRVVSLHRPCTLPPHMASVSHAWADVELLL